MDRIATLRNIEAALTAFEQGETTFEDLQRRVGTILQTYATDFEDDRRAVYEVDGTVVVADSPGAAREQAETLGELDGDRATVTRLSPDESGPGTDAD